MNDMKQEDLKAGRGSLKWLAGVSVVFLLVFLALFIVMPLFKEDKRTDIVNYEPKKFGATYMTMNNPYFGILNDSIKEVVESNGDILITRDPAKDQEKQNEQIQEMIDAGVEAIFINPVDWKKVKPALEQCETAGIPVFDVDTLVYDMEYIESTIISDNYNAGVQCAMDIMKKRDSARIVVLNDPMTNSILERVQGFEDTLAQDDRYQIVEERAGDGELEVSMEVMNQILADGIEFDVVLGGNDPSALGALAALQANHKAEDVAIYGVDGSPDGKTMIRQGYLEASSAQSPRVLGRTVAETAYAYLNGEKIEQYIVIPVTLITSENLDEFDVNGWQ